MSFCLDIPIGARSSALSRVQVQEIFQELQQHHPRVTFSARWVETTGDLDQKTPLSSLDKTDFFTKEIDELLLQNQIRIGIHSAKDLPEPLPKGLILVALTKGIDPSDSLVFREGQTLQDVKFVGTSSFRREANIKALHPDLACIDIRGNIASRLEQLNQGKVDALIVAEAALIRLQLTHLPRMTIPGPTAALQGQLAVVARQDDTLMQELFSCLHSSI